MRANSITFLMALGLLTPLVISVQVTAQQADGLIRHHHYKPIDVGTFGGPSSYVNALFDGPFFSSANVMNKNGVFAGWADTPTKDSFPAFCFNLDCYVSHALQWHDGFSNDLGSLADGWSSAATWINNTGEIVGLSQNGVIDPAIGFPEEHAVLWRDGQMIDLGTFGGNQSAAFSINNNGQIAGLALNTTPDPFSIYDALFYGSANGTQTRAVLWDKDGSMQDLGTLGGPDAYALFVNDRGQVAGWSYTNSVPNASSGGLPTFHPFVWEKGKGMKDLGTLGGTVAQAVNAMNQRGQVAGATTMAGDQTHHPFLWDGKRLIDLGTFGGPNGEAAWLNEAGEVVGLAQKPIFCPGPGDFGGDAFLWSRGVLHDLGTSAGLDNSEADFINSKGQVVGYSFSCDFSTLSAFLWEQGSMVDLNTLIPSTSELYLRAAEFISDGGEIAALGLLPSGDSHVVLLIPCDENHSGVEGCDYSPVDASDSASRPSLVVSGAASRTRTQALIRRMNRYHFPGRSVGPRNQPDR
jgi:probable HAF family extracellular repeat protein